MSLSNAVCPKCAAVVSVESADDASICTACGAPFITAKAISAFSELSPDPDEVPAEEPEESGEFEQPYYIELIRPMNKKYGNSITFIHLGTGKLRPRPLPEGGSTVLRETKKRFEIPVYIKGHKKLFEGVLTGVSDGSDIRIVWDADPAQETLGVIVETNNPTVSFIERPGATDNW